MNAKFLRSTVVPRLRDVTAYEIYSSMLVGHGATGCVKLFTTPLGQPVQRLGDVWSRLFPTHIPITTNLMRAGELGSSLGDFGAKSLRLDFIGAQLMDVQTFLEHASYRLCVSAKIQAEGGVRDLPRIFSPLIEIDRCDTVDLTIEITEMIDLKYPFLLRAVMSGNLARDVQ